MHKNTIRWKQLQFPTTDDVKAFWHDLANVLVTFAVLFDSIAWIIWATGLTLGINSAVALP